MRFENYKLYHLIDSYDNYGNLKRDYEFVSDINVYVNEQHREAKGAETGYYVKVPLGVTTYDELGIDTTYKISNLLHEYEIQSFILGRLTQLQLKEVQV